MHPSAMDNGALFFKRYLPYLPHDTPIRVVDIGAQNVNGSLREVSPTNCEYIGVDFAHGAGVDVVIYDPYELPFEDDSVDVVVSSSCLEHSEMFWLLHLEVLRILRPHGLFYLNVPSNGAFHRYPVDCWRFYPDSGRALVNWSKRNGINSALLESFVSHQKVNPWNDFVAVFVKDASQHLRYPDRMHTGRSDVENAFLMGSDEVMNFSAATEDLRNLGVLRKQLQQMQTTKGEEETR